MPCGRPRAASGPACRCRPAVAARRPRSSGATFRVRIGPKSRFQPLHDGKAHAGCRRGRDQRIGGGARGCRPPVEVAAIAVEVVVELGKVHDSHVVQGGTQCAACPDKEKFVGAEAGCSSRRPHRGSRGRRRRRGRWRFAGVPASWRSPPARGPRAHARGARRRASRPDRPVRRSLRAARRGAVCDVGRWRG